MIARACSSSRVRGALFASSTAMRRCSGVCFSLRPRRRSSATKAPTSRSRRHIARCELYNPSWRSGAPTAPGFVQRSACSSTDSLYAALNRRRLATARTAGSGVPLGAAAAAQTVLAVPARAASAAAAAVIILNLRFSDIGCLPFDSISSKVGVSPHIGTNGCLIGGHHRRRFRYRPQDDLAGRLRINRSRATPSRAAPVAPTGSKRAARAGASRRRLSGRSRAPQAASTRRRFSARARTGHSTRSR